MQVLVIMSKYFKYSFVPDEVLQNTTVYSKNPLGGSVYFQGYRYTGVYEFSDSNTDDGTTRNPNAEPLGNDIDGDEIES